MSVIILNILRSKPTATRRSRRWRFLPGPLLRGSSRPRSRPALTAMPVGIWQAERKAEASQAVVSAQKHTNGMRNKGKRTSSVE